MVFVEGDVEIKECWAEMLDLWQSAGPPPAFKITVTSAFFSTFEDHISSFIIKTKSQIAYIKIISLTLKASLPSLAGDGCLIEIYIYAFMLCTHIYTYLNTCTYISIG